jgi:hypothetical protein
MLRDVPEPADHETGFGTGLWPRLAGRGQPQPADEHEQPAVASEEPVGERSEVDELWTELEAALEREASLRKALAEHGQLQARATELEQALAAREAELAELRAVLDDEARPREGNAREYLRRRAEQHADLLWRSFQDGLTAIRTDGTPDYRMRLEAARVLLAEAYEEGAVTPAPQSASDELADLRALRNVHRQPS